MKITIMKQFNNIRAIRALFCIAAMLMVFTTVNINSAYAQDSYATATETPSPTPKPEPTPYKKKLKHTKAELDELRAKITDVFTTVEDASNTILPDNANARKRMTEAKAKLALFSDEDMDQLRDSLDPAEMDADLQDAKDKLGKIKQPMAAAWAQSDSYSWDAAAGGKLSGVGDSRYAVLPGIADPNAVCKTLIGMGKAQLDVLIAAKAAYVAAKILNIALDRGCNQVVVAGVIVLGEGGVGGGNSSLACIVSDGLLLVADTLYNQILYCDTDFTRRSVDTAVERMKTVHDDLDITTGKVDETKTAVTGARTDILADASTNKTAIMDAMGKSTTTITTAVGDGTTTIVNNDNTNKSTIVNDAKANKDFLLRAQIEADLSSTDGATFVAMFLTPAAKCFPVLNDKGESVTGSTQCGYLDFARAIVVQTISNLAGSNASQANSFLASGDSYKTAGNYKMAYQNYRQAYKAAAGIATK